MKTICRNCGASFEAKRGDRAKYCSRECADKARWQRLKSNRPDRPCPICGTIMKAPRPNKKFCSAACASAAKRPGATKRPEKSKTMLPVPAKTAVPDILARILNPCFHAPDLADEIKVIGGKKMIGALHAVLRRAIDEDPTLPFDRIGRAAFLILAIQNPSLVASGRRWRAAFVRRETKKLPFETLGRPS